MTNVLLIEQSDLWFQSRGVRGYVYVAKTKTRGFKIGCSRNPEERVKVIKQHLGEQEIPEIRVKIYTDDMYRMEYYLHQFFAPFRDGGEFFLIPDTHPAWPILSSITQARSPYGDIWSKHLTPWRKLNYPGSSYPSSRWR